MNRSYSYPASIRFAANSGFTGTVSVPIIVHGASSSQWFDATLRFVVTEGSDAPLRYTVEPGGRVSLQSSDFIDACYNATGYDLSRIHLDALPASAQGTLYYDGSSSVSTNSSTYYYRYGSPQINRLSFLAASDFTGSLEIPFTGYANGYNTSNGRLFSGAIMIVSTKAAATDQTAPIGSNATTLTYYTTGPAVALNASSILGAAAPSLPGAPATITLSRLEANEGRMYLDFVSPSRNTAFNHSQSYPVSDIGRISYLPKAGFSGVAPLRYTVADASGNTFTGSIDFVVTPPTRSSYFSDMNDCVWAVPAVDFFYRYGVTNGNSRTGFGPTAEMRRGDFILLLSRSFAFPAAGTASFADVQQDKYYAPAIASAKSLGIVTGGASSNFDPDASITRQDAALYLYRALRRTTSITPGSISDLTKFPDYGNTSSYAVEALGALVRLGIFNGDYGRLRPRMPLSRAETITILYRALV